jgi:hypothetical protein
MLCQLGLYPFGDNVHMQKDPSILSFFSIYALLVVSLPKWCEHGRHAPIVLMVIARRTTLCCAIACFRLTWMMAVGNRCSFCGPCAGRTAAMVKVRLSNSLPLLHHPQITSFPTSVTPLATPQPPIGSHFDSWYRGFQIPLPPVHHHLPWSPYLQERRRMARRWLDTG